MIWMEDKSFPDPLSQVSGDGVESGDDLDPVLASGFDRLVWVGVDGGLTVIQHFVLIFPHKHGFHATVTMIIG